MRRKYNISIRDILRQKTRTVIFLEYEEIEIETNRRIIVINVNYYCKYQRIF